MRNYWLRIVVGAVAIFMVGMIGVTLARQGVGKVRNVVEGSGPISVPIAFIPFKLNGQKLGKVSKIVLQRDAPKQIASVDLTITLPDSALARGLGGCRLAANIDKDHSKRDAHLQVGPLSNGVFTCLGPHDTTGDLQDFGHAVFEPGHVTVPLLLPKDIADDLQQGNFGSDSEDSITDITEAKADSISEAADQRADSIAAEAEKTAKLVATRQRQLLDSIRREGLRRADSARGTLHFSRDSARRH